MTGAREVGHTKDVGWEIGVSRTIDQPIDRVWAFLTSPAGLSIWLGEGASPLPEPGADYLTTSGVRGQLRSRHELDRIRLTWQPPDCTHDTTLQLAVRDAGNGRTMVRIHQERLADSDERERQRSHWREVLTTLTEALG